MWLIVIATSFYQRVEMLVIKAFDEMVDDILKTKDFTETFGTYPNVRFKSFNKTFPFCSPMAPNSSLTKGLSLGRCF